MLCSDQIETVLVLASITFLSDWVKDIYAIEAPLHTTQTVHVLTSTHFLRRNGTGWTTIDT